MKFILVVLFAAVTYVSLQVNCRILSPYLYKPLVAPDPETEALQHRIDLLHRSIEDLHKQRLLRAQKKILTPTLPTSQRSQTLLPTYVDINLSPLSASLSSHFSDEHLYYPDHLVPHHFPHHYTPYIP